MSENETLEEMAIRVIQRMKAELKEAGYERFSELFNKGLTLKYPYEPDMMLWDEGLFFHSLDQAYAHLQKERKFEAMEAALNMFWDAVTDITEDDERDSLLGRLDSIRNKLKQLRIV